MTDCSADIHDISKYLARLGESVALTRRKTTDSTNISKHIICNLYVIQSAITGVGYSIRVGHNHTRGYVNKISCFVQFDIWLQDVHRPRVRVTILAA